MVDQSQGATTSLGALRERFPAHKHTLSLIFGVLLLVVAVVFGYAYFAADPEVQRRSFALPIAIVSVVLGIPALLTWFSRGKWTVEVYEQGLVRRRGDQSKTILWDNIVAVWQYQTRRTSWYFFMPRGWMTVYTIQTKDGEQFTVDNKYKNAMKLGQIIQSEVTNRLLPQMARAYQNGETVNFGELSLNQQGLIYEDKQLPWNAVKELKIDRHYIFVDQEGGGLRGWATVQMAGISNVYVFKAMVESIRGVGKG
jgi:hypothetical protein